MSENKLFDSRLVVLRHCTRRFLSAHVPIRIIEESAHRPVRVFTLSSSRSRQRTAHLDGDWSNSVTSCGICCGEMRTTARTRRLCMVRVDSYVGKEYPRRTAETLAGSIKHVARCRSTTLFHIYVAAVAREILMYGARGAQVDCCGGKTAR